MPQLLQRAALQAENVTEKHRLQDIIAVRNKDYEAFIKLFRKCMDTYRDRLPGICIRHAGWAHARRFEATDQLRSQPAAVHLTQRVAGDLLGHGKELGKHHVTEADILCNVTELFNRSAVLSPAQFRGAVQALDPWRKQTWAWHPLCWQGPINLCDPRLTHGAAPGAAVTAPPATTPRHQPPSPGASLPKAPRDIAGPSTSNASSTGLRRRRLRSGFLP